MSLLTYAILLAIIIAVLYVLNRVLAPPRVVVVIVNVVSALVLFFMTLALFGLMALPFHLK